MDRETFRHHFATAAARARDYARTSVAEPLPEAVRFRLRLNSSYDGNPLRDDQIVYPADGSFERARALHDVNFDEALAELWREGRVPEWVDLVVVGETGEATLIEALVCGRFTADDQGLYHQGTGHPPFSALGPAPPADHPEGRTFSIHHACECWGPAELDRAATFGPEVRALELVGATFDDERLARLPPFPAVELLVLRHAPVRGPGLAGLASLPNLRHLRAELAPVPALSLAALPALPRLRSLDLRALPGRLSGLVHLAGVAPALEEVGLSFGGDGVSPGDGRLDLPALEAFQFSGATLPSELTLRASALRHLTLCGAGIDDEAVLRFASPHRALTTLSLDGTAVTDRVLGALGTWPSLRRLRLAGTRVSPDAARRAGAARPNLTILPCPPAVD
jgi:hypothetical protein